MFIGALEHCMVLIRRFILAKLNIPQSSMLKKNYWKHSPNRNSDNNFTAINRLNGFTKFKTYLDQYQNILQEDEESSIRNHMIKTENSLLKYIMQIPEDERKEAFNSTDAPTILNELKTQINRSNINDWITTKICDIQSRLSTNLAHTAKAVQKIRDIYADDAAKVMRNIIWKQDSPACSIELKTLEKYHSKKFSKDNNGFIIETGSIFSLNRI